MTSYYVAQAFVEGPREQIVGMLNTILHNVGVDRVITDKDDVTSANLKIKNPESDLPYGLRRSDFFDEKLVSETGLQQKRDSFLAENAAVISTDEYVNLVEVTEKDGNWAVEFTEAEVECEPNLDWPDWGDIARAYGFRIIVDQYDQSSRLDFCYSRVLTPDKTDHGHVDKQIIEPRHPLGDYYEEFERLKKLDSIRYRELKIDQLENLILEIKEDIAVERINIVAEKAERNGGHVFIPKDITDEWPASLCPADIESIEVHPDNPFFTSEGNCLLSKDRTEVVLGCRNSVIPDSVKHVRQGAYYNVPGGKEIEEKYSSPEDYELPL